MARSKRRDLGVTARRGKRTGVPEVSTTVVNTAVQDFIRELYTRDECELRYIKPQYNSGEWVTEVTVRDAATGAARKVGVHAHHERTAYIRSTDQIAIGLPRKCSPVSEVKADLAIKIRHEMTHAADTGWRKAKPRTKPQDTKSCDYFNEPTEVAAYAAEVRQEIMRAKHVCSATDVDSAMHRSPTLALLRKCLTPKNLRRVLKIGAKAWADKCRR